MSSRLKVLIALMGVLLCALLVPGFTKKKGRNQSEAISQKLEESKTTTDNLRNAMRYLARLTPLNREQTAKEVQLELNTWIQTADRTSANYSPPRALDTLPKEMMAFVGCGSPLELQFSLWDVDYLFERRMMNKLSAWIVDFPLRDSILVPILEKKKPLLSPPEALRLEEACKLFDWAMRNVGLEPDAASVEEKIPNPEGEMMDGGIGYGYLPWETLLFSFGDFIEKGRVFTALAHQRGIPTAWIAVDGNLWAISVLVEGKLFVFEPKVAFPILDPDTMNFATLEDAIRNERVLRRMDLPGRFDYAYDPGQLQNIELLIDLPPTASSARMKMLEQSLLSDERMQLYHNVDDQVSMFQAAAPEAKVRMWQLPLMAQVHAAMVRERLSSLSDYTAQYMARHGIWMMDNPAANGRLNHLYGLFENTLDEKGALSLYMACRFDDESIRQLAFDPRVQLQLGVPRGPNEDKERFDRRIVQAQFIFRKAKVDAAFLMAQLHFDRGNYSAAENWFQKRVIDNENPMAQQWNAIARYGLARVFQEMGEIEKAAEQLTFEPSPQEAGNRLRLRYLRDMSPETASGNESQVSADSE